MVSLNSLLVLAILAIAYAENTPGERDLRKYLFENHDKFARPVKKHTAAVPVNVSVSFLKLRELNEVSEELNLETWIRLDWIDEYLTWNPADYDNISVIRIPPSHVWVPDIALYTGAKETSFFPTTQTRALLYNNGRLLWVPPFSINSRCSKGFKHNATGTFAECNIRMGSWTYSGLELDLQLSKDKADLSYFDDSNPQWKLVKVVADRDSKFYPCCVEEYPFVDFNVTLKSRD